MRAINVYKINELSEDARQRAIENWRSGITEIFWTEETIDSLKALIDELPVVMHDYSLGSYGYSYIKLSPFDAEDLSGPRAMAWIENNLLSGLRIPFVGKKRWELSRYGRDYRAGKIKPCPLTGYCADDDLLNAILKSIKTGSTVKEAIEGLADRVQTILQNEEEYQNSDEYIMEHLEANEYEFTEDGVML